MLFRLVNSCQLLPYTGFENGQSRFDNEVCSYRVIVPDILEQPPVPKSLQHRIDRMSAIAIKVIDILCRELSNDIAPERIGLYIGNVFAGWAYGESQLKNLVESGPGAVHPFQATAWFPAAIQGEITILRQWKGIAKTFSGFGSAFSEALLGAVMSLRAGRIDAAIVCAVESNVSDFLSWGADLRNSNRVASEAAFALLLTKEGFGDGLEFDVSVVDCAAKPNGTCLVDTPVQWIEKLSKTFESLRLHGDGSFDLPLSGTDVLRIERQ